MPCIRMRRDISQRRWSTARMPALHHAADDRPNEAHVKLLGIPLDRADRNRRYRMDAVHRIQRCDDERQLAHFFRPEAGARERVASGSCGRWTGTGLAAGKGERGECARWQIRSRQILFYTLDPFPGHPLAPEERACRRIAEATGVLLTHNQRNQVRDLLVELYEQTILGVQVDQCAREPRHPRVVSKRWISHAYLAARVCFELDIARWLEHAGAPRHVL